MRLGLGLSLGSRRGSGGVLWNVLGPGDTGVIFLASQGALRDLGGEIRVADAGDTVAILFDVGSGVQRKGTRLVPKGPPSSFAGGLVRRTSTENISQSFGDYGFRSLLFLTYDITGNTGDVPASWRRSNSTSGIYADSVPAGFNGSVEQAIYLADSASPLRLQGNNFFANFTISNVKIYELPFRPAVQETEANRPTFQTGPSRLVAGVGDLLEWRATAGDYTIMHCQSDGSVEYLTAQALLSEDQNILRHATTTGYFAVNRTLTLNEQIIVARGLRADAGFTADVVWDEGAGSLVTDGSNIVITEA